MLLKWHRFVQMQLYFRVMCYMFEDTFVLLCPSKHIFFTLTVLNFSCLVLSAKKNAVIATKKHQQRQLVKTTQVSVWQLRQFTNTSIRLH